MLSELIQISEPKLLFSWNFEVDFFICAVFFLRMETNVLELDIGDSFHQEKVKWGGGMDR